MKSIKRIFIISLSIIILSVNIATFAIKPIQAKAAVAVPVAAVGSVVWNLLITAFVAAGVYDIVDDYDKQKMVYDDFLKTVKVLDPPLPDSPPDISFPDIAVPDIVHGYEWWMDMDVVKNLGDFDYRSPNSSEPPDNNSWKNAPTFDFVLGASMLAKIADYASSVFNDQSKKHVKDILLSNYEQKFSGTYETDSNKMYIYRFDYFGDRQNENSYKREYGVYRFFTGWVNEINGLSVDTWLSQFRMFGIANQNDNNGLIKLYFIPAKPPSATGIYTEDYLSMISNNSNVSTYKYNGNGTLISTNTWNWSYIPLYGFNGNFPVFNNMKYALNYVNSGKIEGCMNLGNNLSTVKKPRVAMDNTSSSIFNKLKPIVDVSVGTDKFLNTDTLVDAVTATETKLQPELEKATETGTDLDTPTYDKIFTDSLNDAITKTETETKPDPKPDPPVTKPDVEQGNPDDLLADLKSVFPFCIPFDLIHAFTVLQADAEAPYWEIPFKAPLFHIDYTFVIDFNKFNSVAQVFRTCETIGFIIGLILVTRKLIKG